MFRIINVGERTCKLTWSGNWSNINGTGTVYYVPEGATLYASPYLVITPQGYTKHYYAEQERITSQIGNGGFSGIGTPLVSDSLVQVKLQAVTGNVEYHANLTVPDSGVFAYLDTLTNRQTSIAENYFYHPDHLGSSSWITDSAGNAIQHLYYLPWGEDFVNQRTTNYAARFTFSAKEKDAETGLSYFGSRYYSSDLSIWLSVDPMSDKYPSSSPYAYCRNNPIILVDPNGEDVWIPEVTDNGDIRLLYEEGDDYQSLTDFLGGDLGVFSKGQIDKMWNNRDENGNVILSKNIFSKAIKNAIKLNYPTDEDILKYSDWNAAESAGYRKNYNCFSAAVSAAMGDEIGYGLVKDLDEDLEYGKWYSTNTPIFGKTLLRFEYARKATHAAIFFGKDRSGNTYVFTKNGPFPAPKIMLLQDVENIPQYGTVTPLRTATKRLQGNSGMYNYGHLKRK